MSQSSRPVFLIGMMGAGKTTVGRLIARELGREFIDADRELEKRSGVSVGTIFELEGEPGFRRRETALLDELTSRAGIVLATGGGAVLQSENRERLRERGLVIYLKAAVDEIVRRTARDKSRPLLQTTDPRVRVEELIAQRQTLYAATAHVTFQSAAANPRKLVQRVLAHPDVVRALDLAPHTAADREPTLD